MQTRKTANTLHEVERNVEDDITNQSQDSISQKNTETNSRINKISKFEKTETKNDSQNSSRNKSTSTESKKLSK